MPEFGGKGSGSERFDSFLSQKVQGNQMTDDEIRARILAEKRATREAEKKAEEEKRKVTKRKIGAGVKGAAALVVGLGITLGGFTAVDRLDKGARAEEYNNAMRNYTWEEHGSTTYPGDLSKSEYADVEEKFMIDNTEDIYDLKEGEGAFGALDEKRQDALVGETYHYYGKDENKPENVASVEESDKEWAHDQIGEDTTLDKLKDWFDSKN